MALTHRLRMFESQIALLDEDVDMERELLDVGWGVAMDARQRARKRTGEGAASIRPWPGHGPDGPHVDVSWDQDHFYMIFHEFGTQKISKWPAVGPALDHYLHI